MQPKLIVVSSATKITQIAERSISRKVENDLKGEIIKISKMIFFVANCMRYEFGICIINVNSKGLIA